GADGGASPRRAHRPYPGRDREAGDRGDDRPPRGLRAEGRADARRLALDALPQDGSLEDQGLTHHTNCSRVSRSSSPWPGSKRMRWRIEVSDWTSTETTSRTDLPSASAITGRLAASS